MPSWAWYVIVFLLVCWAVYYTAMDEVRRLRAEREFEQNRVKWRKPEDHE